MSYNEIPDWTKQIVLPNPNLMTCPTCGVIAGNVAEVMSDLLEHGYHYPRHIPPYLTFTCFNPDCPDCDQDFVFELSATVVATRQSKE